MTLSGLRSLIPEIVENANVTVIINIKCCLYAVEFERLHNLKGPGSVVGIATAYGVDGPEIESRWGRDFPHVSRPALRPTQPPVQ